ncbi:Oidioi.mRNA.OKI2018_I69.XSR.g16550.t1.cds [Oikopleura dioica]|uniref:Oidioi.mRNA.OKI2018_I69.XSR.g16550.t1.cds n=1 Tax=Oikopleura dioica TaxID=34765 RepID=A0ABN7SIB1_OIKDI|nr:Oidioi.mRNA.OKI2018_I69.XSR.g16550.t1.cds [Oikopleura dioica]
MDSVSGGSTGTGTRRGSDLSHVRRGGLELRYPSQFKKIDSVIIEEDEYRSTKNDRTVNYRKCVCPFIVGVVLMIAGIVQLGVGLALRDTLDTLGYSGGISILFAIMCMMLWYACSLEVEDREMPRVSLPKKSKGPPKWLKNNESRTQSRLVAPDTPDQTFACFPTRSNNLETKAVVELDELSTSTSHQNQNHQHLDPTTHEKKYALPMYESPVPRPVTLELGGESNPAFVDECNDTPC